MNETRQLPDSFWQDIEAKAKELIELLNSPQLDRKIRQQAEKKLFQLRAVIDAHESVRSLDKDLEEARQQREKNADPDLEALYDQEIQDFQKRYEQRQEELQHQLYPPDERDSRSVFIEIRPAAGGQESGLFVGDLARMYTNYSLKKGWQVSIASATPTDIGGYSKIVLHIQGSDVYGHLKHESGVHRVQRVPATESSGRIHTSTATVAVLPESKDVEVSIDPGEIRIDVYRASGAGGQHVNTTDSAVRITHIPTGIVATCQDERSQHKNKAKALKMLHARLEAHETEKQAAEIGQKRKAAVGTGMRAEKVRTYNYPQNRVTDHQVNVTLKKLDMVMEGALDEIINVLMSKDREQRHTHFSLLDD